MISKIQHWNENSEGKQKAFPLWNSNPSTLRWQFQAANIPKVPNASMPSVLDLIIYKTNIRDNGYHKKSIHILLNPKTKKQFCPLHNETRRLQRLCNVNAKDPFVNWCQWLVKHALVHGPAGDFGARGKKKEKGKKKKIITNRNYVENSVFGPINRRLSRHVSVIPSTWLFQ